MARLRCNTAGNTIAMAAAALIPLIAAVGGAIDLSRFYMASARMQAACDSGALAARKRMGDNIFEEADRLHGLTFFDQNFAQEMFGINNLARNYSANTEGTVSGTASGALPTTLMQIFGFGELDLAVTCSAEINISNTDILFVLDVTGSMNCPDNGSACPGGNNGNVESATARIKGLRTAVISFYDAVEEATSDSAQVRYGVVPYASNVNVGHLIPAQHLSTEGTYSSRRANFDVVNEWQNQGTEITNIVRTGDLTRRSDEGVQRVAVANSAACTALAPADSTIVTSELGFHQGVITTSTVGDTRRTSYRDDNEDITFREGAAIFRASDSTCLFGHRVFTGRANIFFDVVEKFVSSRTFRDWTYDRINFTIEDLYDDKKITLPTGPNGTDEEHNWNEGCILEADTVLTDTYSPRPADAFDLDINLVPTTNAQRWKPQLPSLMYTRFNASGQRDSNAITSTANMPRPLYDCPREAMRLNDVSRADLVDYVNNLAAISNTYHDIGMIWGARFISPRGIFASDNATAPNGDAIGRHIVFMTDGLLQPNRDALTPYGVDWWDRLISGNGNGGVATSRHSARFQAACAQSRQENISVWIVAFGTTLTTELVNCATPGRAYHASDSAELQTRFQEIAQRIAALRLTQ